MFKQGDYQYFQMDKQLMDEYLVKPGDKLTIQVFSKEGFDLIDVLSVQDFSIVNSKELYYYLVDKNGFVDLPILGEVYVEGLTEKQLEAYLEEAFTELVVDPYVVLKVSNRRVFVFMGSEAQVVSLNDEPTSLIEVLAKAGGMDRYSKAYDIKILRGDLKNPEIYTIDLSTIQGLRDADLIVQTGDIIYVEERLRVSSDLLREITPILALVTTLTTVILLFKN